MSTNRNSQPLPFGLVLSGGAARGFAHVGVLKAFDNLGLKPSYLAGTSMGALVACFYASGIKPIEIYDIFSQNQVLDFVKIAWRKGGVFKLDKVRSLLEKHIPSNDFKTLQIPLCVTVSNLSKGRVEHIQNGQLFEFVLASCAIPVVFEPISINSQLYVDGALCDNLPAKNMRNNVDVVFGVDVNPVSLNANLNGIWEIAERTLTINAHQHAAHANQFCEFLIEAPELTTFSMWDFNHAKEIMDIGEAYTTRFLNENKEKINRVLNP